MMQPMQILRRVGFCRRFAVQGRVPEGVAGKPFSSLLLVVLIFFCDYKADSDVFSQVPYEFF